MEFFERKVHVPFVSMKAITTLDHDWVEFAYPVCDKSVETNEHPRPSLGPCFLPIVYRTCFNRAQVPTARQESLEPNLAQCVFYTTYLRPQKPSGQAALLASVERPNM
jgi:hypothetical protein